MITYQDLKKLKAIAKLFTEKKRIPQTDNNLCTPCNLCTSPHVFKEPAPAKN